MVSTLAPPPQRLTISGVVRWGWVQWWDASSAPRCREERCLLGSGLAGERRLQAERLLALFRARRASPEELGVLAVGPSAACGEARSCARAPSHNTQGTLCAATRKGLALTARIRWDSGAFVGCVCGASAGIEGRPGGFDKNVGRVVPHPEIHPAAPAVWRGPREERTVQALAGEGAVQQPRHRLGCKHAPLVLTGVARLRCARRADLPSGS